MRVIVSILFLLSFCFSNFSEAGSSFRLGTNAREISLSNTLAANYNSGFNAFSNPALLNKVESKEYGFSVFSLSLDRSIQTFSFSMPLPPKATIGLSIFRASTKNIQGYDALGNPTESEYSSYEGYAMASFAIKINKLFAGMNFKLFKSKLVDGVEADGIGFDAGLFFEIDDKSSIGLKISNLSSTYNWSFNYNNFNQQYEEKHPLFYSIAGSSFINISSGSLLILPQFDFYDDSRQIMKIGFEYSIDDIMYPCYFRIGGKIIKNYDFEDYVISMGFGMPIKLEVFNMEFNYAIDPGLMNEGVSHIISLSFLN